MKCKSCKREIDLDSIFCKWCGTKQLKERGEIKVPAPKVLPSGSYFGRVMVDGRRVSITAPSEQEYYAKARAAKSGLIEVKKSAPSVTVGEIIDRYIAQNKNTLSPSTLRGYTMYKNTRFQPVMKKDPSRVDWQAAINDELEDVKPKTVSNAYHLITAAMRAADIPVPEVKLPKGAKPERPWLDYEQITVFLEAMRGKEGETGALLALHSLRRSEIYALTSDKIDLDKGMITIRGAAVLSPDNELIQKATNKNIQSAREVPIVIPRLTELLRPLTGTIMEGPINTLYTRINAVCRDCGLPEVGVHGLRHSFASLAYHLGWSEEHTRLMGGWKDSQIVHEIYTHLAMQDKNSDIERMKEFYKSAQ